MTWMDDKTHPDRNLSPHEVEESKRVVENEQIDSVFASPADGLDRVEAMALESGVEDEMQAPEVADELDHAGLEGDLPEDYVPGGVIEEHLKGLPAKWRKASP